ncbi:hypothetical protein BZA77DRAFT_75400 [Pyronema omphalodes]|nr:hypothetical protein BZA77DRAFT_75400 [Pyronema omphalodes]
MTDTPATPTPPAATVPQTPSSNTPSTPRETAPVHTPIPTPIPTPTPAPVQAPVHIPAPAPIPNQQYFHQIPPQHWQYGHGGPHVQYGMPPQHPQMIFVPGLGPMPAPGPGPAPGPMPAQPTHPAHPAQHAQPPVPPTTLSIVGGITGPLKKASQMDDSDRLALLKFCIQCHKENVYGRKKQFWSKMSLLLQQERRVLLKDPQSTVDDMVAARRNVLAQKNTKSDPVKQHAELIQTLDRWIEIEDDKKVLKVDAKKPVATKEKEAEEAAERRANLLKPRSEKKKRRAEEVDEEGEASQGDSEDDADWEERPRSKRRKTTAEPGTSDDTQALLNALKEFGQGIENAILKSAEIRCGITAIEDLRAQVEADREQRDKQREEDLRVREQEKREAEKSRAEMREMLTALLAKLS